MWTGCSHYPDKRRERRDCADQDRVRADIESERCVDVGGGLDETVFMYLEDMGSTNGTYLNGRQVKSTERLRMADLIRIGDSEYRYQE